MMLLRRSMMIPAVVPTGLPDDYLQVEYLQGVPKQQYFDTGICADDVSSIKIEAKWRMTKVSGSHVNYVPVFGDYSAEGTECTRIILSTSDTTYLANCQAQASNAKTISNLAIDTDHTVVMQNGSVTIDGTTTTLTTSKGTTNSGNIALFANNTSGISSSYENYALRIYYFKVYSGLVAIRDFIPCIRKSDSKPGMYDLVGRQFYTNAGTGEFLTGYVADGLVFKLDGIERGGVSGKWKDLVGGITATLNGTYTENTDHIYFPATSPEGYGIFDTSLQIDKDVGTIDIAVELTAYEGTGRPTVSFKDDCIGGSISSLVTGYGGALRWYLHNGSMKCWRFPESAKSLVITASGNSDRGMCNGYDGTMIDTTSWQKSSTSSMIAYRGSGNYFKGKMYAVRIYNRKLSAAEMLHNQRTDNIRYSLGLTI